MSLLLLSACGQKGPLYLPTPAQTPASAGTTQVTPAPQSSPVQR
ncbi:LPS translocon maturation chaperone LptM [Hydrogenophaga sp. PBL-H3]